MKILLLFLFMSFQKEHTDASSIIVVDTVGVARDCDSFRILGVKKVCDIKCDSTKFIVNFN